MSTLTDTKPVSFRKSPPEIAGSTNSYLVEWEDGTRAIFKPCAAMQPSRVRWAVDADSEVAAYRLAQLLGYDGVPETSYATYRINGSWMYGSVQRWVENATTWAKADELPEDESAQAIEFVVQRTVMALFDQLIGNWDRHNHNILLGKDGKLWGIDHGLAFKYLAGYQEIEEDVDQVDLKVALVTGAFDLDLESRLNEWINEDNWHHTLPAQLETMNEALTRWTEISYKAIETAMIGCNPAVVDDTRIADYVHARIKALDTELRQALKTLREGSDEDKLELAVPYTELSSTLQMDQDQAAGA